MRARILRIAVDDDSVYFSHNIVTENIYEIFR